MLTGHRPFSQALGIGLSIDHVPDERRMKVLEGSTPDR
jgi:hypothetical protein